MAPLERLIAELARPGAYPHPAEGVEVVQTHVSVVFLAGERVYKLKKPVDLGFLDFRSLDTRRRVCEDEVLLNRRLAPAVYLGVVPITEERGALRVGGTGEPIEWAVEMVRLPADRMLDRLLEAGAVDDALVVSLAELLARFHADAATGPGVNEHGTPEAVARNVRENFEQTEGFVAARGEAARERVRTFGPALHAYLRTEAERFLAGERALLERRVATGRIRDGHGDLHAGNVCVLEDGIVVYDCIEFADRFRCSDVACDLAFLAMDLDARGARALGRVLVERYAHAADDRELADLLRFYKAYRAMVRAKVDSIAAAEPELAPDARADARRAARAYAALAAGYCLPPALVVTSGLPGTGKTTLARQAALALGAVHLRGDVVRKELAGLAPEARAATGFGEGIYSEEMTDRTYAELEQRAEEAIGAGSSVVVDSTFGSAVRRAPLVRLAARLGVPFALLHTTASDATVETRLRCRAAEYGEASDADIATYRSMKALYEPPDELPGSVVAQAPAELDSEEAILELVEALCGQAASGAPRATS